MRPRIFLNFHAILTNGSRNSRIAFLRRLHVALVEEFRLTSPPRRRRQRVSGIKPSILMGDIMIPPKKSQVTRKSPPSQKNRSHCVTSPSKPQNSHGHCFPTLFKMAEARWGDIYWLALHIQEEDSFIMARVSSAVNTRIVHFLCVNPLSS